MEIIDRSALTGTEASAAPQPVSECAQPAFQPLNAPTCCPLFARGSGGRLRGHAGFDLATRQPNGEPFGFSAAEGRIQGHVDGILHSGSPKAALTYPALWECKSMNAKSWQKTVQQGVTRAHPVYAAQIALYQAYLEDSIPGLAHHPALFTAINKDTAELWFEPVPFDGALAQRMSDRAVRVLRALEAGEWLPRCAATSAHFVCQWCSWQDRLLGGIMTETAPCLDFNDAPEQNETVSRIDTEALRRGLRDRLEAALAYLFPRGRCQGSRFTVGDVEGRAGKSLVVELKGKRRGLWKDFSTGERGDAIDLWACARGWSARYDFPSVAEDIRAWLGQAPSPASAPPPNQPPQLPRPTRDELGTPTAKWDYFSAEGNLIACVYRYDPPTGKTYRPWDVRAQRGRAPDPRPLYNLPGIAQAETVVLVEGEQCAQA